MRGGGGGTTPINVKEITVEPLFRVHPRDQGKCPQNSVSREWRLGWGFLIISQQAIYFFLNDVCGQSLFEVSSVP